MKPRANKPASTNMYLFTCLNMSVIPLNDVIYKYSVKLTLKYIFYQAKCHTLTASNCKYII